MIEKNKTFSLETSKEIFSLLDGKVIVIKLANLIDVVPLFCECCLFPMKTLDDSISYRKQKVCSKCKDRWFSSKDNTNINQPDKSSPEWVEYIQTRLLLERPTINLK